MYFVHNNNNNTRRSSIDRCVCANKINNIYHSLYQIINQFNIKSFTKVSFISCRYIFINITQVQS